MTLQILVVIKSCFLKTKTKSLSAKEYSPSQTISFVHKGDGNQ